MPWESPPSVKSQRNSKWLNDQNDLHLVSYFEIGIYLLFDARDLEFIYLTEPVKKRGYPLDGNSTGIPFTTTQ